MLLVTLVFVKYTNKTIYTIKGEGVLISDSKMYSVNEGDIIKSRTKDTLVLNTQQIKNSGCIIYDDNIVTIGDTAIIDYTGNLDYVKPYSTFEYSNGKWMNKENNTITNEAILKTSNDYLMLSNEIAYQDKSFGNYLYLLKDESGYIKYYDNDEIKGVIPHYNTYLKTTNGQLNLNSFEYTTEFLDNYKINKIPSFDDKIDDNIMAIDIENKDIEDDQDMESSKIIANDQENLSIVDEKYDVSNSTSYENTITSGIQNFFEETFDFVKKYEKPKVFMSIQPKWDYSYFDFTIDDPTNLITSINLRIKETGDNDYIYDESIVYNENTKIIVNDLKPNKKYSYVLETNYINPENGKLITLSDNGSFFTNELAIDIIIEKITEDSIMFDIKVDDETEFDCLNIIISDSNGLNYEKKIEFNGNSSINNIQFDNLASNEEYKISLSNVFVDGKKYNIKDEIYFKTSKAIPIIGQPQANVDYINQNIIVSNNNIIDNDELIETIKIEVYKLSDDSKPIYTDIVNVTEPIPNILINVDQEVICRNENYMLKVYYLGNDNYEDIQMPPKVIDVVNVNGAQPPIANIKVKQITSTSIAGSVKVSDIDNTLSKGSNVTLELIKNNKVESQDELDLNTENEFVFDGLTPSNNYELSIKASFDLNNGQDIYSNVEILKYKFTTPSYWRELNEKFFKWK